MSHRYRDAGKQIPGVTCALSFGAGVSAAAATAAMTGCIEPQRPPSPLQRQAVECMHEMATVMHMRTTLNIDDDLLQAAARVTGETQKTALVRRGLEALVQRESARQLARMGGTAKDLKAIPRRRLEVEPE